MIADRRLYFVCEGRPHGAEPTLLLETAVEGGVDLIQLREKDGDDESIIAASKAFRRVADAARIPFILNDRPDLVEACGADGVHIGQQDETVARARELAGSDAIVGLSTHDPEQMAAANEAGGPDRPDYISVGPVWETPTKAGRQATGLDYVRLAARESEIPWFAIGGIGESNVGDVVAAGAERIVVVRAIRDAADPLTAARDLRAALEPNPG